MLLINSLIVLLIPFIFGLFLLSLFLQKRSAQFSLWEKLALAFPIGLGFLVILMFLLALARIPLTLASIIISITLIIIIISIYLFKKKTFCININEIKNSFKFKELNLNLLECVLIFMLSLKVLYVFFSTLIRPLIDVDAFQQYSIVAKGIFYQKTFLAPYLQQFILDKPLFPYLSQGWVFIGLQTIDDALLKLITPILFVCLLVIFYSALRRYYARNYSLLFTFTLSTLPFLFFHVATAYADFPQTFYYSVATIYLFLFMKDHSLGQKQESFANLVLALLFLGISVWVKRAGIFLAGINIFVLIGYLLAYRKTINKVILRKLAILGIVFILIIAPWIIYGQAETLIDTFKGIFGKAGVSIPSTAIEGGVLDKTDIVLSILLRKLFLYADWHLLWFLFLTTLVFFYKKSFSKPLNFLLAIILLNIAALFVQFRFGGSFMWILDGTLLDRLVMNYIPVVLFFCAEAITPSITSKTSLKK